MCLQWGCTLCWLTLENRKSSPASPSNWHAQQGETEHVLAVEVTNLRLSVLLTVLVKLRHSSILPLQKFLGGSVTTWIWTQTPSWPSACVSISHVAEMFAAVQGHWVQAPKYLSFPLFYIKKKRFIQQILPCPAHGCRASQKHLLCFH